MGARQGPQVRATGVAGVSHQDTKYTKVFSLVFFVTWWLTSPAAADPILREAETNAEVSALAALGDVAYAPDVRRMDEGSLELALARAGFVAWSCRWPIGLAARVDLAEAGRLDEEDFERHPVAASDALVDDLYAVWAPRVWAEVRLGRQPVPFSRFRQLDRMQLLGGSVPFLIDRVAPERRWGASFHGDLGAMAYAAGAYADGPTVEQRPAEEDPADPSTGGRAALAAHVEWTPRAPVRSGDLPSPVSDPWRPVPRVSAGAGALVRLREPERGTRTDLSASGIGTWGPAAAMLELVLSVDGGQVALSAAGEASVLVTRRALLYARADRDIEIEAWTAGGGAAWFIAEHRRTALQLFAWDDGVILELRAAL